MESQNFPWIIPGKGMPFCRIIGGKVCYREIFYVKACLSTVKSVENLDFSWTNLRKVKTFLKLSYGKFQYTAKSTISLSKGFSILLQIFLDKKSTMGGQYYLRSGRKILKHGITENSNFTFSRYYAKVKLCARISSRIREKI